MIPSGTSPAEIIYQEEGKNQIELATQSRKPVELSEFETRTALKHPNLVHRIVGSDGADSRSTTSQLHAVIGET